MPALVPERDRRSVSTSVMKFKLVACILLRPGLATTGGAAAAEAPGESDLVTQVTLSALAGRGGPESG